MSKLIIQVINFSVASIFLGCFFYTQSTRFTFPSCRPATAWPFGVAASRPTRCAPAPGQGATLGALGKRLVSTSESSVDFVSAEIQWIFQDVLGLKCKKNLGEIRLVDITIHGLTWVLFVADPGFLDYPAGFYTIFDDFKLCPHPLHHILWVK